MLPKDCEDIMGTPAVTPDLNHQPDPPQAETQPEKKTRKYQPVYPDGHELAGQPMGGEQVIEYDGTEDDLFAKMVANNNRIQAELRRMSQERSLAPTEQDEPLPPGSLSRKKEAFARRDFTPEEKIKFAKGLADPTTIQETFDAMSSARVGSNEEFKSMTTLQIQAAETNAGFRFGREHPEMISKPNETAYTNPYGQKLMLPRDVVLLLSWCDKRDLYHTYNNLVLGYDRLKKAGLLSDVPIAAQEDPAKSQPVTEAPPVADSTEMRQQPIRRPVVTSSALTNRNSRPPAPVTRGEPTWKDIESLSAEQLKAKPADWKKAAYNLFRKLPANEVNKKLDMRGMEAKLQALTS
jgi:hypothetical protein